MWVQVKQILAQAENLFLQARLSSMHVPAKKGRVENASQHNSELSDFVQCPFSWLLVAEAMILWTEYTTRLGGQPIMLVQSEILRAIYGAVSHASL